MPKEIKQKAMNNEEIHIPDPPPHYNLTKRCVWKEGYDAAAERAKILTEALKTLRHGIFKDEKAVNDFIDEALNNYLNQQYHE